MKTKLFALILLLVGISTTLKAQTSFGQSERLCADWLFSLDHADLQPTSADFDDSAWTHVDVPHDWSAALPMSPDAGSCQGYLHGGIGWYRKHLRVSPDDIAAGRRVYIYFEGVYNRSRVYVNGTLLGYRPSGFSSFLYDLTPYLHAGDDNIIAVSADHSRDCDSRWYTGSGINRPVWLVRSADIHLALWGTAWRVGQLSARSAKVEVDVEADSLVSGLTAVVEINDAAGRTVARRSTKIDKAKRVSVPLTVTDPHKWTLTSPYLYTIVTRLMLDGKEIDTSRAPLGLRTLTFSPDKGFALNGEWMKVKGVCVHDDAGVLGTAVHPDVWRSRLLALKSLGVNALRMSHNPHLPALYDLCDSLGLLVMDEASDEWEFPKRKWLKGWNRGKPGFEGTYDFFEEWIDRDVRDMVLRDRCHPSVFLWSIGNEVDYPNDPYSHPVLDGDSDMTQPIFGGYKPEQPNAERIGLIAERLAAVVRSADTSRPVTGALAGVVMSNATKYPDVVDVVGYNYTESRYAIDHKQYPKRIIYGSENRHDLNAWNAVKENDYIFGQFLWTGIDYLGESGPWPARGSEAGLLDLAGFVKPNSEWRKALWTEGTAPSEPQRQRWGDQTDSRRPVALRTTLREGISTLSDEHIVQIVVEAIDDNGQLARRADSEVTCRIVGFGRLLGLENGNIRDTRDKTQPRCRLHGGRLVAYVAKSPVPAQNFQQRGRTPRGADLRVDSTSVRVSFYANYLEAAEVTLTVE